VRLVPVAAEVVLPDERTQHSPLVCARTTVLGDDLSAWVRDEPPFPAHPPDPHVLRFPGHVQPPFRRFSRRTSTYSLWEPRYQAAPRTGPSGESCARAGGSPGTVRPWEARPVRVLLGGVTRYIGRPWLRRASCRRTLVTGRPSAYWAIRAERDQIAGPSWATETVRRSCTCLTGVTLGKHCVTVRPHGAGYCVAAGGSEGSDTGDCRC
jgi:hypothetical protein